MVLSMHTGRVLFCSSVSVVTRLWVWWTRNRGLVPSRGKRFFSYQQIHTSSMANTATYSIGTKGVIFPGGKCLGYEADFFKMSRSVLWCSQPPVWSVLEFISPGIKQSGLESYHSPPSSVEAKKKWSCTSPPPYAVVCVEQHLCIRSLCLL